MPEQNTDADQAVSTEPTNSPAALTALDSEYRVDDQPAFIVGVTGNMDPTEPEGIKDQVRWLFRFLRRGTKEYPYTAVVDSLLSDLISLSSSHQHDERSVHNEHHDRQPPADPGVVYREFFHEWPGLEDIPIIVLSSLAPGADQLVAEVVLEPEFRDSGFHLRCPLPFPMDVYRTASTFVRKDPFNPTQEQIDQDNQRLENLRTIIPEDSDERCFAVALKADLSKSRSQLTEQYARDVNDKQQRRLRYQVAGEYMAAYSHLMIAIWDHQYDADTSAGTAAIVNARRSGLTPDLLPSTTALSLPPDDPTYHIFTKREKRRECKVSCRPDWSTRWLFAKVRSEHFRDGESTNSKPMADNNADWQKLGLNHLSRTTQLLRGFCSRKNVEVNRAEKHLTDYLSDDGSGCIDKLRSSGGGLLKMVQRVADLRRRAADRQREEATESKNILSTLFWLTLAAALLIGASHHWHPQNVQHASKHTEGHGDETKDKHEENLSADQKQPGILRAVRWPSIAMWMRFAISFLGIAIAAYALRQFHRCRPRQHGANAEDLRAIAEGARVQMLWHIAGVGQSVAANYLQRQRGELSWIRKVIRSVGMPYENARWQFDALDTSLKIDLLKCVRFNWLRGHEQNAQFNYFRNSKAEHVRHLHFWHKLGRVLVVAGLMLCVAFVVAAFVDTWRKDSLDYVAQWCWNRYMCWLLFIAVIPLTIYGWLIRQNKWKDVLSKYIEPVFDRIIRTVESTNFAHHTQRFSRQMLVNFCWYLPSAFVVAGTAFLLCVLLSRWEMLPNAESWLIILSSSLLVAGGLSMAWPERQLFPESIYQYGTMASLFQLAANRVDVLIRDLEFAHQIGLDDSLRQRLADEHERKLTADELTSFSRDQFIAQLQSDAEERIPRLIREIQGLYFELGKEALDENAEWLILHRARPLEPVLAA